MARSLPFPPIRRVSHHFVTTCNEAAAARGIPLWQELKTIILEAETRCMAVHLRGDQRVNFRAVKQATGVRDVRFLDLSRGNVNLSCGTINPWNVDFCKQNMLDNSVLRIQIMATNNAIHTEGIFFYS